MQIVTRGIPYQQEIAMRMNLWFVCMIDLEDTDEDDLSKGEVVNGDYIYISV